MRIGTARNLIMHRLFLVGRLDLARRLNAHGWPGFQAARESASAWQAREIDAASDVAAAFEQEGSRQLPNGQTAASASGALWAALTPFEGLPGGFAAAGPLQPVLERLAATARNLRTSGIDPTREFRVCWLDAAAWTARADGAKSSGRPREHGAHALEAAMPELYRDHPDLAPLVDQALRTDARTLPELALEAAVCEAQRDAALKTLARLDAARAALGAAWSAREKIIDSGAEKMLEKV